METLLDILIGLFIALIGFGVLVYIRWFLEDMFGPMLD